MRVEEPLITTEWCGRREECVSAGGKRILRRNCRRKLTAGGNIGEGRRNLLPDIGPRALKILGHLGHCGPVIKNYSKGAVGHCLVIDFEGKTEPGPVVGMDVVGDPPSGAYHHMIRKTRARDARGKAAHAAQRRQLLHNEGTVAEIHVAGFGPSMLTYRRFGSVSGQEGVVVAQPVVQGEPPRSLPGILKEGAQQTAGLLLFIYVAPAGTTVGNVQQKRGKGVAGGGTKLRIGGLRRPKAHPDLGKRTGEIVGIVPQAKLDLVVSEDLRIATAIFPCVGS